MISLAKEDPNSVVKLVVKTRGGITATKQLLLVIKSKDDPSVKLPCQYTVDPTEGVIVTQTDVPNLKVDQWRDAFQKLFTVTTDDPKECPINQWYSYENFQDSVGKEILSIEEQYKVWNAQLTSPKTISYFYRAGGKENPEKRSNIFQVILTRCGTE
jgi:hypothetical protein